MIRLLLSIFLVLTAPFAYGDVQGLGEDRMKQESHFDKLMSSFDNDGEARFLIVGVTAGLLGATAFKAALADGAGSGESFLIGAAVTAGSVACEHIVRRLSDGIFKKNSKN